MVANALQKDTALSLGASVLWHHILGDTIDAETGATIRATVATRALRVALIKS